MHMKLETCPKEMEAPTTGCLTDGITNRLNQGWLDSRDTKYLSPFHGGGTKNAAVNGEIRKHLKFSLTKHFMPTP